jgi:hypothetical protein
MTHTLAKPGTIWVCAACGKTARDDRPEEHPDNDDGWDESCMLHAVLCYEEKKDGVWQAVPEGER